MATFAPLFELMTGYEMDFQDRNFYSGKAPDWDAKHYFGTDQNGRDIFVRTMFGMRISMLVALVAASVALVIGVSYGAISGLAGGLNGYDHDADPRPAHFLPLNPHCRDRAWPTSAATSLSFSSS